MYNYFENISDFRNGYLLETPKKAEVINNAKKPGNVAILPGSNNRALIIETATEKILQSYDTIILTVNKRSGKITKNSDYYSKTTLKHINDFLSFYGITFSKKQWEKFSGYNVKKGGAIC